MDLSLKLDALFTIQKMENKKLKIMWDIDDTLIVPRIVTGLDYETPNYENISIFRYFQSLGYDVGVWSGSGIDWAKTWAEKLGLKPDMVYFKEKRGDIDLCFDDCIVELATVNIKVKRLNNSISRKDWNKTNNNLK